MSGITRRGVLLGSVALLTGCAAPLGNKVAVIGAPQNPPIEAVPKVAVPAPVAPVVWPLTGVQTEAVDPRPAMSVKIENSPQARPQTGLGSADVVWEEMVEGGITRFNAVFHSAVPPSVGPIRSLRPMDAAISAPFGGLFIYSGGQGRFVSQVAATGVTMLSFDGGDAGFARSGDRVAPHNVYGDTATFLAAGPAGPPPAQFKFARYAEQTSAAAGSPVESISLAFPFANPGWTWDGSSYLRNEAGAAATTVDGGQIKAANVVVLRVQVRNTGAVDPAGNPVPETVLVGTGAAQVFSVGKTLEATWSKAETASVLELSDANGEPVYLAPGNVWVELLPVSSSMRTA